MQQIQRRNWRLIITGVVIAVFLVSLTIDTAEQSPPEVETTTETTQETTAQETTTEESKTYFDVPLSSQVQDRIFEECEKYSIDPALIIAIIERESRFDENAIGDNGRSLGLMQVQPKWHYQRMQELNCTNLLNPCQNIKVGVDILAELNGQNSNIHWVLMAYNSGATIANENIASGIITEYATSIIKRSNELKKGEQDVRLESLEKGE